MNDLQVSVKKLTDEELMREACESTFLGKSRASLLDLYKAEHSPVRTQMFDNAQKRKALYQHPSAAASCRFRAIPVDLSR